MSRSKITKNYFTLDEFQGKQFPWYGRPEIHRWRILRQYVYERDSGLCDYCQEPVELNQCHIHHTLELNHGGTNHPTNLKILCKNCHKKRHPFMMDARDKMRNMEKYE